jgi:cysteine desulfurase/selenocysteine lyase
MKFEAGTPGIVQQIGLGVALDYLMALAWRMSRPMNARFATMPATGWRG